MLHLLQDPHVWLSFLTLTILEIVLGIDNIVFISIIAGRVKKSLQNRARQLGLAVALITRLALLGSIAWLTNLTAELFTVLNHTISWRDIILIGGGLFLLYKATKEMHHAIEEETQISKKSQSFWSVIAQIAIIDIVFSLDSVITAVGLAEHVPVMAAAIIVAVIIMLVAINPISHFVEKHPTVKMLALSFLLLVGVALIADGVGFHIPRGYLYFAMFFSGFVEVLNLLARRRKVKKI